MLPPLTDPLLNEEELIGPSSARLPPSVNGNANPSPQEPEPELMLDDPWLDGLLDELRDLCVEDDELL